MHGPGTTNVIRVGGISGRLLSSGGSWRKACIREEKRPEFDIKVENEGHG